MGNNRSHQSGATQLQSSCQQQRASPSRSFSLLQLLRRSWRVVGTTARAAAAPTAEDSDECATDLSSRCSGCKGCGAYQQELHFDSESDMAPNADEDLLVTLPGGGGPHSAKERLRPPTYNAEDYAIALRRWGRRALSTTSSNPDNQGTLPSTCTSSSSGYASGNGGGGGGGGEMTLRQFTSVSELLNKLRADLRLAFPSFVQEFVSPPAEGISLLLETLRGIQLSQSQPPSAYGPGGQTGPRRARAPRRAALDELGCVECLAACAERCPDAARILAQAHPGLLALAVCLTSSLNRSRVLALQLLTKVCQTQGGHGAVSEAVSTLRLRYGEGGRFRFLAGALLAPRAAPALRVAGLAFLNAYLGSAPRAQAKLYIQAEACEAGLEPRALQDWLKYADEEEEPLLERLREEVRQWSRHCVDVDALQSRARRAEETCRLLSKKVSALQRQLQRVQLERMNEYNRQQNGAGGNGADERQRDAGNANSRMEIEKKVSSSAEDEGISFSERSSSPENQPAPTSNAATQDADQETTIDDVIEELRIIVKDAEEELHDWNQLQESPKAHKPAGLPPRKEKSVQPSKARECLRSTEENARMDRGFKSSGSLKIVVPGPQQQPHNRDPVITEDDDNESAIVPAIIHPQPPRRAPPCIVGPGSLFIQPHHPHPMVEACVDSEHEEDLLLLDDDGSDSLLSASRLNTPKVVNHRSEEVVVDVFRRRRSLGSGEFKIESLTDFEISETMLDERLPRKRLTEGNNNNGNSNSLGSKQYSKCSNTVQRRTERRKYLRRCQSQEHVEQQQESKARGGVLDHIRKFESLNSFDDRRSLPNFEGLRRSESFHQTRLSKEYCSSSRGGSDSGLVYNVVDDVVQDKSHHQQQQQRSMTKSLDRIDEGLDSMVDIVVTKERRQLCRRLSNDDRPLRNDERHHYRNRQRSDHEGRYNRGHNRDEMTDDRKYTSFLETRREHAERKQHPSGDPRIFAGRTHDVLGFGKNRFNAGKYSGNNSQQQQQQFAKNAHRNVNPAPAHHVRGKVTDMVSGLY